MVSSLLSKHSSFQEQSSSSHGLSCEPTPLPLSTNRNELDVNYENMIENLLLQQVLLYTHEQANSPRCSHSHRSRSSAGHSLSSRRQTRQSDLSNSEHLVLTSRKSRHSQPVEETTLCLIESKEENSSELIENILSQYNQRKSQYSQFDQNLMDLIIKRNRQRRQTASSIHGGYYFRLQWLAIGLVTDRFFFYLYFTATFVSYFVTLWLIPFSHPNLKIDIHTL